MNETEVTSDDSSVCPPEVEVSEENHEEKVNATSASEPEFQKEDVDLKQSEREKKVEKSVEDQENRLGNWFNNEIRSRIQVTPKGWQLIIAG